MTETKQFLVGGKAISKKPYHYRSCGLDDVFLLNGFEVEQTDGRQTSRWIAAPNGWHAEPAIAAGECRDWAGVAGHKPPLPVIGRADLIPRRSETDPELA